jgi:hypothetical protein
LLDDSRELRAGTIASEREARQTAQVLKVIIRDLAPGR